MTGNQEILLNYAELNFIGLKLKTLPNFCKFQG